LNWFHATTREDVVRREVLMRPGDRFTRALADETERNLRVRQLSVVLVTAVKGSDPDRVRILVVTKDVWSLRVNWEPTIVNGKLQALLLQPSEENLLGRHKTVNGNVGLDRSTYTLGLGFTDPRVGGSRLQATGSANLAFNCRTGDLEGSNGAFSYGKPLYSIHTKWAWSASVAWASAITRPLGVLGQSICSDDTPVAARFKTPEGIVSVPYRYHSEVLASRFGVVRSFGVAIKSDVSFGLESSRREYSPFDLSGYSADVRESFTAKLPLSDTRLSPFVQLHGYRNEFLRTTDLETLGLQEDVPLGHDIWLKVYPALESLGSSRNLFGVFSGLGYTLPLGDGLARAYATSSIQLSQHDKSDAEIDVGARLATPRLPFGRLIIDGLVQDRYWNYLNPSASLGGTTRLRGYRTQAFAGPDVVVANVELRSPSVDILTVQVGAGLFYDVGDAFDGFDHLSLRHGVGGGLRFVIPQIDRAVFRVEVGVPLNRNDPAGETTIVAQFRQAFPLPSIGPL
jgi:hypothetical protein